MATTTSPAGAALAGAIRTATTIAAAPAAARMDILRPSAIADPIILHSRACIPEPETNMRAARVKFRVKFRLSNRRRFSICSRRADLPGPFSENRNLFAVSRVRCNASVPAPFVTLRRTHRTSNRIG
jgi:hypothetical protein